MKINLFNFIECDKPTPYEEGRDAFKHTIDNRNSNPYKWGSPEFLEWDRGFATAWADYLGELLG